MSATNSWDPSPTLSFRVPKREILVNARAFRNFLGQGIRPSVIELTAAAINCDERNSCKDEHGWAVAAGSVSTAFTMILLIGTVLPSMAGIAAKLTPPMSIFLFLWWIPGAVVPTFKDPFRYTGNGYFSCWAAFLLSLMLFQRMGLPMIKYLIAGKGDKNSPKVEAVQAAPVEAA
eukprot:gene24347-9963_t